MDRRLNRRRFLQVASGSLAAMMLPTRSLLAQDASRPDRPNFLWISTEDISPDLGCYGDAYAVTPNLDRFASEGVRYETVFSHAGVCADAFRHHHRHVSDDDRDAAHALCGCAASRGQVLPRVPASGGLLLYEQRQDRLPVRSSSDGMGRIEQQGPLAKPSEGQAVLLSDQLYAHPRKQDSRPQRCDDETPGESESYGAARPGQGRVATLLSRHAQGSPGLGAVL